MGRPLKLILDDTPAGAGSNEAHPLKIETVEHVKTRVVMMPRGGAYGQTTKTRESRVTLARVRFTEGAPLPAGGTR